MTRIVRRYAAYVLLLIAVLISAGVVGGICGTGRCSGTSSKIIDPVRAAAIAAFINNITLTNKTIAYPPVSVGVFGFVPAEELALRWLIEDDPLNLTASDHFQVQQRYALVTLRISAKAPNGRDWTSNTGWLTADGECTWFGILCTSYGELQAVVEQIDLGRNQLQGRIPADLGLLQNLKAVQFSSNALSGSLPESIGRWTALETFKADYNAMTGTLPHSIGNWTKLEYFDVSNNKFTGTIPESVAFNMRHSIAITLQVRFPVDFVTVHT